MEVVDLPLGRLRSASWNPNSMTPPMRARLAESISRYGAVEPLVVRRVDDGYYEVLSGNQRLGVYAEMGTRTAPCVVLDIDDVPAMLLAQVLNRTRGEDDLGLKAELLRRVIETVPKGIVQVLYAAEGPIQLEYQDSRKLLLSCVILEPTPFGAVSQVVGRGMVNILVKCIPALGLDELPQGKELGLGVLILIGGTDPGIDGDSHH